MSNFDKMDFQLKQQLVIHNNMLKSAALSNNEWERQMFIQNAEQLLVSIEGLKEVLKTIKD